MLHHRWVLCLLVLSAAWLGCGTDEVQELRSDLPGIYEVDDTSRDPGALITYEYRFAEANPESLLKALIEAHIPVVVAWEPLDNECMDPLGPRFTVGLSRDDPRIIEFDFIRGGGRLACSPRIRKYEVRG